MQKKKKKYVSVSADKRVYLSAVIERNKIIKQQNTDGGHFNEDI